MIDPITLIVEMGTPTGDLWYALFFSFGIIIFAWAKGKVADVKAALIFTVLIGVLFWNNPVFIWVVGALYLYATWGKQLFKV